MRNYSPEYARRLMQAGQPRDVDLSLTGAFMEALTWIKRKRPRSKSKRAKIKLGWEGTSSQRMRLGPGGMWPSGGTIDHNELYRKIKILRPFLTLNNEDKAQVSTALRARVKEWFKKRAKNT